MINKAMHYPDLWLWDDSTWVDRECAMESLLIKLRDCILQQGSTPEYYPERHDEVRDAVNAYPYFSDVVAAWRENGLVFSSYGMMGLTMAPVSVDAHKKNDPIVLYIPAVIDRREPHAAMNLLKAHEDVLLIAAKEEILVQFISIDLGFKAPLVEHGLETQGNFHILHDKVFIDLSPLEKAGLSLQDVLNAQAGFWNKPEMVAGRIAVDISDKWQARMGHQYCISRMYWNFVPEWDYERHIRTEAGQRQASGMRYEYEYEGPHDARLLAKWRQMGLRYEDHFTGSDWWITLTPESALEAEEKIPLFVIFKEPRTAIPSMMLTAYQFYDGFIQLAAQGHFMVLFYALETPEDNDDYFPPILEEAMRKYPVDRSRVYITGQSHNGYYALEYYRRHPRVFAGAATLNDPIGLECRARVDYYDTKAQEIIASFRKQDMPLINILGELENTYRDPGRTAEKIALDTARYLHRLQAFRCPNKTEEEIVAAARSKDYATRKNGVPADRTEVQLRMGVECYVSDVKNQDGKWHLRFVSLENTPHMIMPQMGELSWEYLRRFSRDQETGEIVELYGLE